MFNLIDHGLETLIAKPDSSYAKNSNKSHILKKDLNTGLVNLNQSGVNHQYRVLTQALFESGYLELGERCFNTEQLLKGIYGVKMNHALPAFLSLFDILKEKKAFAGNKDSWINTYNDNYIAMAEFQILPDEDDRFVSKISGCDKDDFRKDIYRQVIYIENQSPAWLFILERSIYTGEPTDLIIVRLKQSYDDPEVLNEFLDAQCNPKDLPAATENDLDTKVCKIVGRLDFNRMECVTVINHTLIEAALFQLGSASDFMSDN